VLRPGLARLQFQTHGGARGPRQNEGPSAHARRGLASKVLPSDLATSGVSSLRSSTCAVRPRLPRQLGARSPAPRSKRRHGHTRLMSSSRPIPAHFLGSSKELPSESELVFCRTPAHTQPSAFRSELHSVVHVYDAWSGIRLRTGSSRCTKRARDLRHVLVRETLVETCGMFEPARKLAQCTPAVDARSLHSNIKHLQGDGATLSSE
jgi:hypothetical protein